MPPCRYVLTNKVRRANLLAALWKKANTASPSVLQPKDHGWILDDGACMISWYNCDELPKNLIDILSNNDDDVNEDEDEEFLAATYASND